MKPETYKLWEEALNHFRNAEKMLKNKNFQQAAKEAEASVYGGMFAIKFLSDELGMRDLMEISFSVLLDYHERSKKHYAPKEIIGWARRTLKRLSDECPPDTFRPLR